MKLAPADAIKVYVRVRPFNQKQKATQASVIIQGNSIQMIEKQAATDHRFSFDQVFQSQSTQQQVYDKVGREVVEAAFQGFNGTVFAYGQTSSGKTHTCIGPDYINKEKRGILPRMIGHIFDKIKQQPSFIEFRIKISMVEIYMEKIKDLLDTSKSDLKIRQKVGKGIYIQDVTEEYVASEQQTVAIIKKGIVNRSVGQTNMNDTSSRSHMAFIITLYQNNLKDASAKSGKIMLVDLAGSEKVGKTGAQGKLLDEAKQINKSLLALGNVINSITENKITHIPYRDSKLTRLLQESLGGNSKTNLIINVSPSQYNWQQTLSSLRFGYRAKQVKNKPKVNKQYTVSQLLLLLEKAQKRIQQLELMIGELSLKKTKTMKKTSQIYVENLLDSDHPIMQTDQEEKNYEIVKQKQRLSSSKKIIPPLKIAFDSECIQSSDEEAGSAKKKDKEKLSEIKLSQKSRQKEQSSAQQLSKKILEQKQILAEEIQMLNIQRVEFNRQMDILQQKYEIITKQNKSHQFKLTYLQKQNEKLLSKLVSQTCLLQQNQIKMQQLQEKVSLYEQKILNIAALQERQNPISKVFGSVQAQAALQTKKIAQLIRNNKIRSQGGLMDLEDKIERQIIENQNKDKRIKQLQSKNKTLQGDIALFKHLQKSKQAFIEQKMKFSSERERVYKDLQNRIQKVLELQERLDQQIQRRKYYEQLIKSQQSQKNRKILLLQQHINEISENLYVLKGQQSSWQKDTKRVEQKLQSKNKRILALQKDTIQLKQQIESLKIHLQDLETNQRQDSILDIDFNAEGEFQENQMIEGVRFQKYKPKIVKVVRSSNFKV